MPAVACRGIQHPCPCATWGASVQRSPVGVASAPAPASQLRSRLLGICVPHLTWGASVPGVACGGVLCPCPCVKWGMSVQRSPVGVPCAPAPAFQLRSRLMGVCGAAVLSHVLATSMAVLRCRPCSPPTLRWALGPLGLPSPLPLGLGNPSPGPPSAVLPRCLAMPLQALRQARRTPAVLRPGCWVGCVQGDVPPGRRPIRLPCPLASDGYGQSASRWSPSAVLPRRLLMLRRRRRGRPWLRARRVARALAGCSLWVGCVCRAILSVRRLHRSRPLGRSARSACPGLPSVVPRCAAPRPAVGW